MYDYQEDPESCTCEVYDGEQRCPSCQSRGYLVWHTGPDALISYMRDHYRACYISYRHRSFRPCSPATFNYECSQILKVSGLDRTPVNWVNAARRLLKTVE